MILISVSYEAAWQQYLRIGGKEKMDGRRNLPVSESDAGRKLIRIVLLVIAIVLLMTVIRPVLSSQSTYKHCTEYLDEKLENAKMLTLGSASASFIISLLPDDTGSAIADRLSELSGYLLLVVSAIFLEKSLLTAIGMVSSAFILPLACVFAIFAIRSQTGNRIKYKEYAYRLLIFGICMVLIIPLGCFFGQEIEKTNAESIEKALNDARNANEIVKSLPEDGQNKNVFDRIGDFFSGIWKSATDAYEWAKTVLSNFMSSIAVMLVTTVVMPLLIVLCFLWLIKFLTKRDFILGVIGYADRFAKKTGRTLRKAGNRIKTSDE